CSLSLKLQKLAQCNGEAANGESKDDGRDAGAHPRKKGTLVRKVIAGSIGISSVGHVGTSPLLFHSLLKERSRARDVFQKIGRDAMPLLKIFGRVVGKPDFALRVLPGERLQRKIDGDTRGSDHQRRAAFGIAEDQELRGTHREAGLGSFAAVIDERENCDAFFFENGLQARQSFRNGIAAGDVYDSWVHAEPPDE